MILNIRQPFSSEEKSHTAPNTPNIILRYVHTLAARPNAPLSKQLHATLCVFSRLSAALASKLLPDPEGSARLSRHANWLPWVAFRHKHILEEREEREKKQHRIGSRCTGRLLPTASADCRCAPVELLGKALVRLIFFFLTLPL